MRYCTRNLCPTTRGSGWNPTSPRQPKPTQRSENASLHRIRPQVPCRADDCGGGNRAKPGQLESTSEGKVGLVASRLYRKPRCSTALSNSTSGSISRQCGINPTASPQPNLKPA